MPESTSVGVLTSTIEYQRPATLQDAIALLSRPGSVVLAGGTAVNAGPRPAASLLVDLQGLGLDGVTAPAGGSILIGATTRLSDVAASALVPSWLADLARKELPSSLRTLATVGGTVVAGGWQSALVAGLLACDAVVTVAGADGTDDVDLPVLLAEPGRRRSRIITAIHLDVSGSASVHATARTSADRPIVACVVRRSPTGDRVAMSGVADTAVVVDDVEHLAPPGDFRGSSEYRHHLARVLQARALAELGGER